MPMMEELAERLKVTEDELLAAVADTGYELVPAEPSGDEEGMVMEEVESPDDAGPEQGEGEEEGEEEEDMGQAVLDSFMPFNMTDEEMTPQMTLKVERAGAAHRAINGDKNKDKGLA